MSFQRTNSKQLPICTEPPPNLHISVYSTDQMQGIGRVRFDHILNARDERVYCYRRTRLELDTNAFSDGKERV